MSVAQRVTSSRFVGRRGESSPSSQRTLAGEDPAGLPALFFIAGESGVGKTRLLARADRHAPRQHGARGDRRRLRRARRGRAALRAAGRERCGRCSAPASRCSSELSARHAGRARAAQPGDRRAIDRARDRARRGAASALRRLPRADPTGSPRSVRCCSGSRTSTGPTARPAPSCASSPPASRPSASSWSPPTGPTSCTAAIPLRPLLAELERTPRARRIELERFDRAELSDQLTDILGAEPQAEVVERLYGRSERQPAVHRGADRGGCRRARLAAAEPARGAAAAGRAALGGEPAAAARARRRRSRPTRSCSLRRPASIAAAVGRGDARGDRGADRRRARRRVGSASATRCCARSSTTTCSRRALASSTSRSRDGARARRRRAATRPGRRPAIAHHYYAAGDQPQALRAALEASTARPQLHAYGEAAALLDRALELWPRVAGPRAG